MTSEDPVNYIYITVSVVFRHWYKISLLNPPSNIGHLPFTQRNWHTQGVAPRVPENVRQAQAQAKQRLEADFQRRKWRNRNGPMGSDDPP